MGFALFGSGIIVTSLVYPMQFVTRTEPVALPIGVPPAPPAPLAPGVAAEPGGVRTYQFMAGDTLPPSGPIGEEIPKTLPVPAPTPPRRR